MTETKSLRMAKATAEDIDAAMDVHQILRAMDDGGDHRDVEGYGDQDSAQEALLVAFDRGSLMRVIWGMAVLLDPKNEIVDPDSDVLAAHPKVARMQAEIERLQAALDASSGIYDMAQSAADAELKMRDEVEWLQAKAESAEKRLAALVHECGDVIEIPSLRRVFPVVHALLERAIAAAKGEA